MVQNNIDPTPDRGRSEMTIRLLGLVAIAEFAIIGALLAGICTCAAGASLLQAISAAFTAFTTILIPSLMTMQYLRR